MAEGCSSLELADSQERHMVVHHKGFLAVCRKDFAAHHKGFLAGYRRDFVVHHKDSKGGHTRYLGCLVAPGLDPMP